MNLSVKPNFKQVGATLGSKVKLFASSLENLTTEEINKLENDEAITLNLDGEDITVTKDMVDIRISSKEGFNVGMENNNFIILETSLNEDLILEGLAREIVSKVQQLRKNKEFNVADRITLYYNGDEEIQKCLNVHEEYIKQETLSKEIKKKDDLTEKFDINGHQVHLDVLR